MSVIPVQQLPTAHRVLIGLPETSRHGKRMSRIDQVYIRIGRVDNAAVIIPGNAGGIGKLVLSSSFVGQRI